MLVHGFKERSVAEGLKRQFLSSLEIGTNHELVGDRIKTEELVRFRNMAEEDCPGGACLKIQTEQISQEQGLFTDVMKPDSRFAAYGYLVNIAHDDLLIEPEDYGWAVRLERADWVLAAEPSASSPTEVGQLWGPRDDWMLHQTIPGFLCTGGSRTSLPAGSNNQDESRFYVRAVQKVQEETIQCFNGSVAGLLVQPDFNRVVTAKVVRPSGYLQDCWLKFIDYLDDELDETVGPLGIDLRYYTGTPAGYLDNNALFYATCGPQTFLAKTDTVANKGTTPYTFRLYGKNRLDSGITRLAIPLGAKIPANKWATVKRFDDGAWYAGCWE